MKSKEKGTSESGISKLEKSVSGGIIGKWLHLLRRDFECQSITGKMLTREKFCCATESARFAHHKEWRGTRRTTSKLAIRIHASTDQCLQKKEKRPRDTTLEKCDG